MLLVVLLFKTIEDYPTIKAQRTMISLVFAILILAFIIYQVWYFKFRKKATHTDIFPDIWKQLLEEHVSFYSSLDKEKKTVFEDDLLRFLNSIKITGVKCQVETLDRVLIGSSAIIPLFGFPDWGYSNLEEVLLYPSTFDENHNTSGSGRNISGMVGYGYMNGTMILSKKSLRMGYSNTSDKKNVGIHEFAHLIDGFDGAMDGIPKAYFETPGAIPWIDMINKKTKEILEDESDINSYGASAPEEFFAVAAEYFFEKPKLLQKKHPALYKAMSQAFMQSPLIKTPSSKRTLMPNDRCHCGSGKKYKKCCGKL